MIYYMFAFLAIIVTAGFIGFGGTPVAFAAIAQVVFFVFLLALVVVASLSMVRRSRYK